MANLDEKLARIDRRMAERREQTRAVLASNGHLDLKEMLSDAVGGKLLWHEAPDFKFGSPVVTYEDGVSIDLSKPGVDTWIEYIRPKRRKGSV